VANTLSRALSSPAFFCAEPTQASVDRIGAAHHHPRMITILCAALSKKAPLPGTSDRRAR
jgi:hypothetical protein